LHARLRHLMPGLHTPLHTTLPPPVLFSLFIHFYFSYRPHFVATFAHALYTHTHLLQHSYAYPPPLRYPFGCRNMPFHWSLHAPRSPCAFWTATHAHTHAHTFYTHFTFTYTPPPLAPCATHIAHHLYLHTATPPAPHPPHPPPHRRTPAWTRTRTHAAYHTTTHPTGKNCLRIWFSDGRMAPDGLVGWTVTDAYKTAVWCRRIQ